MSQYRVFISYSHEDRKLVEELTKFLEELGLQPMWDRDFAFGAGFHDQIRLFIAHAHIFLPVITEASSRRGWVHQEIGYAMALNIPVLPLAKGVIPGEMIQGLQAVQFDNSVNEIKKVLTKEVFDNLINQYSDSKYALHQCADLTEDRAMMMASYAEKVLALRAHGYIRQKGTLSSFNIPNKVITDPIWKLRYGTINRGAFHCRTQREERLALEKHARIAGCRLIIDPHAQNSSYGPEAHFIRLKTLLEFLEWADNEKIEVAIYKRTKLEESVTIVGDWFAAVSVSSPMGQGYRQTTFTTHAPSMQVKIDLFDQEFNDLLSINGWDVSSSREQAIREIKHIMSEIETIK